MLKDKKHDYSQSIPLNATSSIEKIKGIRKAILEETKLTREYIEATINDPFKPHSPQIMESEKSLTKYTSSFNIYLNDLRNLARSSILKKIEKKENPNDLQGFIDDLDSIQRSLFNIQQKIAEFHAEHDQPASNHSEFAQSLWLRTHKDWIIKQVNDLMGNIEFSLSLYSFLYPK